MSRTSQNYQHQDFLHLPTPQQKMPEELTVQKSKQASTITPEKRRRDSLMSDRKLRYVLYYEDEVHDRDCPEVAYIPDDVFFMCEDYPSDRRICPTCYRKAMVRMGLHLDLTKYIDVAMRVFQKVGAANSDLNTLFFQHHAQIYRVEADSVYLKVDEDRWIIQIAPKGCMLYHNNYRKQDHFQRIIEPDFHLQIDSPISFRTAVATVCQYTWEGHIQATEIESNPCCCGQKEDILP